jgi:hypothetical protein
MSRKTLPGNVRLLPSNQPDMELEKGLPVAFGKLIKQPSPRRVRQRLEQPVQVHSGCLDYCATSRNGFVA